MRDEDIGDAIDGDHCINDTFHPFHYEVYIRMSMMVLDSLSDMLLCEDVIFGSKWWRW